MPQARMATMTARTAGPRVGIIDIAGEVTGDAEEILMKAYGDLTQQGVRAVILNFTDLEYMNSSGIGLLVTLLIRANRQRHQLLSYGLSEHYQQIFELTRLNEAIGICRTEADALAAAES